MNAPARLAAFTPLTQTRFAVPDIRCAGCISKLEKGLARHESIAHARVNFTTKQVTLDHQPDATMPELVGAFALLGFEAHALGGITQEAEQASSRQLAKALGVAGFGMMNIMLLSVSIWSGAEGITRDLFHWLSAIIALPVIAYSGRPFFASAWNAIKRRTTNMDVPISIGVLLTAAMSLYETITHGPHAYFDGAVMLLFFLLAGRWLDSVMRDRARDGVTALLRNMGTGALILDANGQSRWIETEALHLDMVMIVAAGERLAADGEIIRGETLIDASLLTGESAPIPAATGDTVHAGTLNVGAPVEIRITATGHDTAIADIARLMGEAAQGRSRYVRVADRAARLYAPAVHLLALLSFAGWMIAGAGWHHAVLIAVAVLIITCPCALGLAVPAAQIVAAGTLMRRGLLVKDGSALERLAEVDYAFIDKTGTVTLGKPIITNMADISPAEQSLLLALSRHSRHPLSEALRQTLEADGVIAATITHVRETAGLGVEADYDGRALRLGRPATSTSDGMASELSINGKKAVIVRFADALRPDATATINRLQSMGLDAMIASGDTNAAVAPVARALGLTAMTSLSPQDKLTAITRKRETGHKVLMVGDGMNDGPALAAGHASIAPGSASDAGKNAADCLFLGDSFAPVATAVHIARRTQAIVRQNFTLAIGYNVIAVPLAIMGYVTPLIAALAMSGSSLIVVGNAMRLKWERGQ